MIGEGNAAGEGNFEALAMAEGVGEDSGGGESKFSCLDETMHGGAVVGDGLWRKCRLQNISRLSSDGSESGSGSHCELVGLEVYTRASSG